MTVRQPFHVIDGFGQQMLVPAANAPIVQDSTSDLIAARLDAFSDGSLSDPTHPEDVFSLAAVWWLGRQLGIKIPSCLEFGENQ